MYPILHCCRSSLHHFEFMQIGFDGRWNGHSGVGNYVWNLLKAIQYVGEDFEIVLYEDPENRLEHISGHGIRRIPFGAHRYSVREQVEFAHRCLADRLDVFHSPFYVTPWLAACPVVVTVHDLIPFLFDIYNPAKRRLVQLGYKLAVRKAARVIVDSENTGADLHRILGVSQKKTKVIHLATSHDLYHPNKGPGELEYLRAHYGVRQPYVLTLSASNWRTKNLPSVLEALAICQSDTGLPFQIVIAGAPEGFREASRRNRIAPKDIILTGFVPAADLPKLYRNADVFLLGSAYEGFGLPLLEAMSCGCAVVSSNRGSLAEVAGPGAVLVDPDEPADMSRAVARLLSDRAQQLKQKERSLKRAADFSWERAARETIAVYEEAASQG